MAVDRGGAGGRRQQSPRFKLVRVKTVAYLRNNGGACAAPPVWFWSRMMPVARGGYEFGPALILPATIHITIVERLTTCYFKNSSKLLVEDAIESADIGETAILKADLGLDRKVGRKPHPNPLIQKNLKFLHEFCNLFGKSPAPGGHVDTAFKRSLRNYSPGFDLVWELSRIESIGSTQKKKVSITNLVSDQLSDPLAETDNQLSPSKKSSSSDSLLGVEETLQSLYKMAEDFANEDLEAADFTDTEHDGSEEGDDELKDVEEMIQQASEELQKVADENQRLITTLDEGEDVVNVTNPEEGESDEPKQPLGEVLLNNVADISANRDSREAPVATTDNEDNASVVSIASHSSNSSSVAELNAFAGLAEEKSERFRQICSLLKKHPNCARCSVLSAELGAAYTTNKPLRWSLVVNHMNSDHPSATRRRTVQAQVGTVPIQKRKFEAVSIKKPTNLNKKSKQPTETQLAEKEPAIPIARKLSQSYNMQEKLVNENASLEDTRYRLQSNLIDKDRTVECLQRQLCSLQTEMRMVHQENVVLNEKLQHCPNASCPKNSRSNSPTREGGGTGVKMSCGPGKGLCPADVENRLQEYSQTTNQLEKQLVDVEQDVKIIQQELLEVQKEREHLEHHRKMLALSPPCHPSPCPSPYPSYQPFKEMKEKYARLQEDFKAKLTEVAGLRADNEKLKELADKAEENRAKLDMKVKELEKKLKELRGDAGDKGIGSREQLIDLQQQLKVHKELYRQAQDELEELRALVEDIQGQLNDYRNKYLEAIQTIEEQRRQIEIMRMENNRISEQVNLEIVRVKNQFQEKLQELAPLPDILKATQVKLNNNIKY
ncbi:hypothetical protein HUJ05_008724 [Dendroctonus ponderosae]|nr:hypothetical protein HUJ05_008724 [Dendroctonus ponderosae]